MASNAAPASAPSAPPLPWARIEPIIAPATTAAAAAAACRSIPLNLLFNARKLEDALKEGAEHVPKEERDTGSGEIVGRGEMAAKEGREEREEMLREMRRAHCSDAHASQRSRIAWTSGYYRDARGILSRRDRQGCSV